MASAYRAAMGIVRFSPDAPIQIACGNDAQWRALIGRVRAEGSPAVLVAEGITDL